MMFTYCGWFVFSSVADVSFTFSLRGDVWDVFKVQYDPTYSPSRLYAEVIDQDVNGYAVTVPYDALTGEPVLVAMYWDGDTMGLSVNGAEWETASTCETLYDDPNAVLRVAGDPSDAGPVSCTKFKAYPRVLTNAEIASLYQEGA